MTREELDKSVRNVLARCSVCGGNPDDIEIGNLPEAVMRAATLAFMYFLSEDDDTRTLRWQCLSLHQRGKFDLEE